MTKLCNYFYPLLYICYSAIVIYKKFNNSLLNQKNNDCYSVLEPQGSLADLIYGTKTIKSQMLTVKVNTALEVNSKQKIWDTPIVPVYNAVP